LAQGRRDVNFIAGPGETGKTASVLAGFLHRHGEFTHYLYISCHNNNNNNIVLYPSDYDPKNDVAFDQ